jgi:uncharacterized protein (DUF2267 family)
MGLNFDKFAQEGNAFINDLGEKLGHPNERSTTSIALRAVLHALRDRISIPQSFNLIAQLPMFLKAVYVENWKYHEKPIKARTLEDFKSMVKLEQEKYGETRFDWPEPTEHIISIVFNCLGKYISEGEIEDISKELPEELRVLFREDISHEH